MPKKSGTKKTAVGKDARHPKSNFSQPKSGTNNRGLTKWPDGIPPENGTHKAQRGHDYKEDPRGHENAKEDKKGAAKSVRPQIISSTPTKAMVKDSQRSKAGN